MCIILTSSSAHTQVCLLIFSGVSNVWASSLDYNNTYIFLQFVGLLSVLVVMFYKMHQCGCRL